MKQANSDRRGRGLAGDAPLEGLGRRSFLRGGLMAGVATVGLAVASSAGFPGVATASVSTLQGGWYWCNLCTLLFHSGNAEPDGSCAGHLQGDGLHALGSSTVYELGYNAPAGDQQSNWAWCGDCQALFYEPDASTSGCAYSLANGRTNSAGYFYHRDGGSTNYQVYTKDDVSGLQSGWNYCTSCRSLFHGSGQSVGACVRTTGTYGYIGKHTPNSTAYWVLMLRL